MESDLFASVLVVITFMAVAMVASLALKRLQFPYTIGLMIIGLGLGWLFFNVPAFAEYQSLELSPELILYLILPTLIFEASMNIDARLLFLNIGPIVVLAVFGLLISAVVVALGLSWLTPITMAGALLFGALISATDPVAVIALFKEIGAPKRLVTLIDGESLFNDATAIVLFTVIAAAVGMGGHAADPSILGGAISFTVVLVGGLVVGGVIGWLGSYVIQFDKGNFLYQIAISIIMAYLSFLVADHVFHFSGVMSSLAAGLALRYRAETAFKRHHIHTLEQGWEFFSFVANSFVFILLGLTAYNSVATQGNLADSIIPVLWSLPIVLVARFLSIYLLIPPYNLLLKARKMAPVPWSYQAILFWGGLRGAVPVALVLAIPESFPDRDLILHLTFGIILFTMLIQGTTVKSVMEWLGVKPDGSPFADRPTTVNRFELPDAPLASLVLNQTSRSFEAEGFVVNEQSEEHEDDLLLRKGSQMFTLKREEAVLVAESEVPDAGYLRVVVRESLITLRDAVGAIDQAEDLGLAAQIDPNLKTAAPVIRALKKQNIVLDLKAGSKESVIRTLLDSLVQSGDVADADGVFAEILAREASMTTGLGKGIATPHAKTDGVKRLVLALGVCREGTDFASLDGVPSKYFAMILTPKGEETPHLKVLSMITVILNRAELRAGLDSAANAADAFQLLRHHCSTWWSPTK